MNNVFGVHSDNVQDLYSHEFGLVADCLYSSTISAAVQHKTMGP